MADNNRELAIKGEQERPVKALTWWNILRAVAQYFLDLILIIILLPRGSKVSLRNLALIFGKFGCHFTILSFTYGLYLAILANSDFHPHGPVSMGINRILGLPADPQCRSRRDLNQEWSLPQFDDSNATLPGPAINFENSNT